MSYADDLFIRMCQDIIDNGLSTEGEKVRPVWEDTGESAYTIKRFGVVNRYDLSKEFPALTLRRTALKSAFDEILWIWQKKSNNIHDLNSHIWDSWADEDGSIGKAYGYQLGVKHQYKEGMMDQVDRVLYDLKNNPYSRRIMTNIYVHQDLHEMNLYPCAYSMTFNVTKEKDSDRLTLNGVLNQRSNDVLAANNWNVSYLFLFFQNEQHRLLMQTEYRLYHVQRLHPDESWFHAVCKGYYQLLQTVRQLFLLPIFWIRNLYRS